MCALQTRSQALTFYRCSCHFTGLNSNLMQMQAAEGHIDITLHNVAFLLVFSTSLTSSYGSYKCGLSVLDKCRQCWEDSTALRTHFTSRMVSLRRSGLNRNLRCYSRRWSSVRVAYVRVCAVNMRDELTHVIELLMTHGTHLRVRTNGISCSLDILHQGWHCWLGPTHNRSGSSLCVFRELGNLFWFDLVWPRRLQFAEPLQPLSLPLILTGMIRLKSVL